MWYAKVLPMTSKRIERSLFQKRQALLESTSPFGSRIGLRENGVWLPKRWVSYRRFPKTKRTATLSPRRPRSGKFGAPRKDMAREASPGPLLLGR